jgi:hypothetical protein
LVIIETFAFVLVASNTTVSIFRHHIRKEVRIPIFVLLIASFVTIVELAMQSFFYDLYLILADWSNRVPEPINSRMAPKIINTIEKPSPIIKPSNADLPQVFLLAKVS